MMKSRFEGAVIRPLKQADAGKLVSLYNELTFGPKAAQSESISTVMDHPGTEIYGAEVDDQIVAMATLHVLPNVTYNARPYALIENVATAAAYQMRGIGKAVMQSAINAAWDQNVYKIMLLTGQKRGARGFYETLGFGCEDKFGMVLRRD
ncbi:GNAT family N-acetyltransferase [Roseobacter sp.]|uniref:GNAT family N-acetyltransferase n=1 Tax=Roseobacter sp. TaxID=1907202 RepID=UPI003865CBD0